jgi:hypothetical protein
MMSTLGFRRTFRRLAPVFSAVSLCAYPLAWFQHPGIVPFLDHAWEYQIPVLFVYVCVAWAVSREPTQYSAYDSGGETDELELIVINPGSGLPMIGKIDGVDTEGRAFGGHLED